MIFLHSQSGRLDEDADGVGRLVAEADGAVPDVVGVALMDGAEDWETLTPDGEALRNGVTDATLVVDGVALLSVVLGIGVVLTPLDAVLVADATLDGVALSVKNGVTEATDVLEGVANGVALSVIILDDAVEVADGTDVALLDADGTEVVDAETVKNGVTDGTEVTDAEFIGVELSVTILEDAVDVADGTLVVDGVEDGPVGVGEALATDVVEPDGVSEGALVGEPDGWDVTEDVG